MNFASGELNSSSVDLHSMAENGLDFLYDRVLYWVRQGRIIPPEAPILQLSKPTLPDMSKKKNNKGFNNGHFPKISSRSDKTTIGEHRPKYLRKLENDLGMQPSSWFRYLEKKKAAEVTSRKTNQKEFLHVLEGQKIDFKDNAENVGRTSPTRAMKNTKEEKKDSKKKKKSKQTKDKDNISSSDADSGLNISFATYKQPSDLYMDLPEDSFIGITTWHLKIPVVICTLEIYTLNVESFACG